MVQNNQESVGLLKACNIKKKESTYRGDDLLPKTVFVFGILPLYSTMPCDNSTHPQRNNYM